LAKFAGPSTSGFDRVLAESLYIFCSLFTDLALRWINHRMLRSMLLLY